MVDESKETPDICGTRRREEVFDGEELSGSMVLYQTLCTQWSLRSSLQTETFQDEALSRLANEGNEFDGPPLVSFYVCIVLDCVVDAALHELKLG